MKDKFLNKKILDSEKWEDKRFGELHRSLKVSCELGVPVYETGKGYRKVGLPQVDIVIERGNGKLSVTLEEALKISGAISFLQGAANRMIKKCEKERKELLAKTKRGKVDS